MGVKDIDNVWRCACPNGFRRIENPNPTATPTPTTTAASSTASSTVLGNPVSGAPGPVRTHWYCAAEIVEVMSEMKDPIIDVRKISNATVEIHLQSQPLPARTFEGDGDGLVLVTDISPYHGQVQLRSLCGTKWHRWNSSALGINLTYSDLDAACRFNLSLTADYIYRSAYVHASLLWGTTLLKDYTFPVELTFERNGTSESGSLIVLDKTTAVKTSEAVGGFVSQLDIFKTEAYTRLRGALVFRVGDKIFVSHTFLGTRFVVTLLEAWLADARTGVVLHNLTEEAFIRTAPPGALRFSIVAPACSKCKLYVTSELTPKRRLSSLSMRTKSVEGSAKRQNTQAVEVQILDDISSTTSAVSEPLSTTSAVSETSSAFMMSIAAPILGLTLSLASCKC